RQKNEILRTIASPARRDRDPIFLVNGVPELSGIEAFWLGFGVHVSRGAITHFTPLDPTFNHLSSRRSIKIFSLFVPNCLDQIVRASARPLPVEARLDSCPSMTLANGLLRRRSEIRKLVRNDETFLAGVRSAHLRSRDRTVPSSG